MGQRFLFAGRRGGLSLERATEKLIEAGYLREGASHSDAIALIQKSFSQPQYTSQGTEQMAQADQDQRFEDHLAAQQEAAQNDDFDPFDSLMDEGFDPDLAAMMAAAEEEGVVFDLASGAELAVDPDAPIQVEVTAAGAAAAGGAA